MWWVASWLAGMVADTDKMLWAACVALICCVCALWAWQLSIRNLPPGPWGLPLVGYLPWLDPVAPHLTIVKLVERYGRVFSLKLGSVLVVVMVDPQVIRDTLSQKSTTGRAPLFLTHGIMKGYASTWDITQYMPGGSYCSSGLDLMIDGGGIVCGFSEFTS
nr:cytochrome P450 18a1-like [Cherax quadricarinatus]